MSEENERNGGELDIPMPFEALPLHRQKRVRRYVYTGSTLFLILVITFVAGLYAYTAQKKKQAIEAWESPGVPVKVIEMAPVDLEEAVEATGVIAAEQDVTVYPEVTAKVMRIEADLGDTVEKRVGLAVGAGLRTTRGIRVQVEAGWEVLGKGLQQWVVRLGLGL